MKNLSKKLLLNKNVVTLLAVVVLVIILYVFYSGRINDAIQPVTVPIANKDIPVGTKITEDMITTVEVPGAMVTDDVITTVSRVLEKYSAADAEIPKGSLFFERSVVEKEAIPANIIHDLKPGYILYYLNVDSYTTFGNSIYPGNYIDLYLKASVKEFNNSTSNIDKVVYGKLIKNIEVISVRDSAGKAVFEDVEEERHPALLIFAVPEEYYFLLKRSEYLRTYDTEFVPVPTNESLKTNPGEIELTGEELKNWINQVTIWEQ